MQKRQIPQRLQRSTLQTGVSVASGSAGGLSLGPAPVSETSAWRRLAPRRRRRPPPERDASGRPRLPPPRPNLTGVEVLSACPRAAGPRRALRRHPRSGTPPRSSPLPRPEKLARAAAPQPCRALFSPARGPRSPGPRSLRWWLLLGPAVPEFRPQGPLTSGCQDALLLLPPLPRALPALGRCEVSGRRWSRRSPWGLRAAGA